MERTPVCQSAANICSIFYYVHCRRLWGLAHRRKKRHLAITFVGTATSQVRQWTLELSTENALKEDARVVLRFGDAEKVRAASRGHGGEAAENVNFTVYMRAVTSAWCSNCTILQSVVMTPWLEDVCQWL